MFRSIDPSLCPMGCMPWIISHLWGFLCIRDTGHRGNKITGVTLWFTQTHCQLTWQNQGAGKFYTDRAIFIWPWNKNMQAKQKQRMNGNRVIWLVYWTDTNARGFWLVKQTPENFLQINRYLALTSYCNAIGRKIPKISRGAYIFQRPFLRGLYTEGFIYGGIFAFQNQLG